MGPFGQLLAGEVFLDAATMGTGYAGGNIDKAATEYRAVMDNTVPGEMDYAYSRARAGMRLAQLGVVRRMYADHKMPTRPEIRGMYGALLDHAGETVDLLKPRKSSRHPEIVQVRGALGEMVVLLLSDRYVLRHKEIRDLVPLQSSYSEDQGGDCLSPTSVFTTDVNMLGLQGETVERLRGLLVKAFRGDHGHVESGPTIYLEDLNLEPWERASDVCLNTVQECLDERVFSSWDSPVGVRLNERSEKLLDAIDRAALMPVLLPA